MLLEGKSFSCSIARLGKMGFGFASSWALQARDSKCAGGQSAKLSHSSGFCLRHLANEKSLAFTNSPKVQLPLLVAGHTTLSALAATLHWEKAGVVFAVACSGRQFLA